MDQTARTAPTKRSMRLMMTSMMPILKTLLLRATALMAMMMMTQVQASLTTPHIAPYVINYN